MNEIAGATNTTKAINLTIIMSASVVTFKALPCHLTLNPKN